MSGPNLDEQIDSILKECVEMCADCIICLDTDKHIEISDKRWLGKGPNGYYRNQIKAIIATQVQEAVKEEKSLRAKLVTKAHKDGIADGLQMALYGVKDGSKEEKFIRHLLYSENIGNKE